MLTENENTARPISSHLHCAQVQACPEGHSRVFVVRPWSFVSAVTVTLYSI
jgi:hypothetical protein